jgi:hypothetical protein
MIFRSRYRIEFSTSKTIVLENINNSIFVDSPNNFAKKFNGKVFENGFKIKVMGTGILTFKGDFTVNKDNQENLELSIGIGYLDVFFYLIACCFLLFIVHENYEKDYVVVIVYLGSFIFANISSYRTSKKSKKIFFNYLENLDKSCEISPVKK